MKRGVKNELGGRTRSQEKWRREQRAKKAVRKDLTSEETRSQSTLLF